MKKIAALIGLFFLLCSFDQTFFEELKQKSELKNDQYLIVVYFHPGSCVKCYLEPLKIIDGVSRKVDRNKIKIIGLIRCDRDIEMKVFLRENDWKYSIFRDDGKCRKKLGVFDTAIMTVFNYNGDKKISISTGKMKKNSKKIINFINRN